MRNRIVALVILLFLSAGFLFASTQSVDAQSLSDQVTKQLDAGGAKTQLKKEDPRLVIVRTIQLASSFVGIIFLILVIYGGFLRMAAAGEEEKIKKSTKIVTGAVIGLAVVIFSYSISALVAKILYSSTQEKTPYTTSELGGQKDTWTIPIFQSK
ncbi:MAG: hypothetical protein ABII02_03290 [Candidatus Magasanikbacteria bacterium]